jgi:hypothetical protein
MMSNSTVSNEVTENIYLKWIVFGNSPRFFGSPEF